MSSLITINHIALRGKSTLNISSDICAICREHVCDKCIKCANGENPKNSQKMCFSVLGKCNHAYHQCCIQGWTNGLSSVRQKCPMCNNAWAIKERSINSNKNNYKNIIKKNVSVKPNNESEQNNQSEQSNESEQNYDSELDDDDDSIHNHNTQYNLNNVNSNNINANSNNINANIISANINLINSINLNTSTN